MMKALRLESAGKLHFLDVPVPSPPETTKEVLLKVTHCALCRTDAKMWREGHRDLVLPRVLGHEICGTLEGEPGHHVVWPGLSCGECQYCSGGMENLCPSMKIIGFHRDGGLAERLLVPRDCLLPLPPALKPHVAALAEPLGCCLNAVHQAKVQQGDRVLIFGAGPVGLMMSLAVRAMNAEPTAVETSSTRRPKTKAFCERTDLRIEPTVPRETFQAAINATSSLETFAQGIGAIGPGGSFCLFSGFDGRGALPASILNEIHYRQLSIVGAYGCTRKNMKEALELMALRPGPLEDLIEGFVGLEGVKEIFPAMLHGEVMKIIVPLQS